MATLNLITNALDILQQLNDVDVHSPNYLHKKKEKLYQCSVIVNSLNALSLKNPAEFVPILELSIETLLRLCDESDVDIRTVAEESLNKIIKGIEKSYMRRIQRQLIHEMKKNGPARSLRAAIWRLGLLSSTISPINGKEISIIISYIVQIIKRPEEIVIETLASSLPLILKSLGSFMNDKDVRILLEACLPLVVSSNAVFRRSAANMILTTCLNCRKTQYFINCVISYVIDTFVNSPSRENQTLNIIGGFGCLKILLPHIQLSEFSGENENVINNYLLIYKCCLDYTRNCCNHNVVNAALESLTQLLQVQPVELLKKLLSPDGLISIKPIGIYQETFCIFRTNATADEEEQEVTLLSLQSNTSEVITKDEQSSLSQSAATNAENENSETYNAIENIEIIEEIKYDDQEITVTANSNIEEIKSEDDSDFELFSLKSSSENGCENIIKTSAESIKDSDELKQNLNIGNYLDPDVPLKYCCRHLISTFLLTRDPNGLISDEAVRVSVKSLTLISVGHIFKLHPMIFFETLMKDPTESQLYIKDILLYSDHHDPQIRGNVSIIIAFLLKAVFANYNGSFINLNSKMFCTDDEKLECLKNLIDILIKGLEDVSAITCRQSLIALNICLKEILTSAQGEIAIKILSILEKISYNPYFLVKVTLTEVLSDLPYSVIHYIMNSCEFQINSISCLIYLLGDQDHRVRHAASIALVKSIPKLHRQQLHEDLIINVTSKSVDSSTFHLISNLNCQQNMNILKGNSTEPIYVIHSLNEFKKVYNNDVNEALSRIVGQLVDKFLIFETKYISFGCCETLSRLSEVYVTTVYPKAWDCMESSSFVESNLTEEESFVSLDNEKMFSLSDNIISKVLNLLCCSPISYDLMMHKHLLTLGGNLITGKFVHNSIQPENQQLKEFHKKLLRHVMRLLNIYVYVIEDIQISLEKPIIDAETLSPKSKLSFEIKSKKKNEKPNQSKSGKESNKNFENMPHYTKLYDILKAAHANYNVTLESEASEMYLSLLNASLDVLSQLLELTSMNEASHIIEELLKYLQIVSNLAIVKSVQCVRCLFKTIFNANLIAQIQQKEFHKFIKEMHSFMNNVEKRENKFYEQYFQHTINEILSVNKTGDVGYESLNSGRFYQHYVLNNIKNFIYHHEKKTISSILLFQPMVLKSLIQYKIIQNDSVALQCQVLKLLTELVRLHINYCLLDSDSAFINYVQRQFEFIEGGHIHQTEILLPAIFDFLISLSYTKYTTKEVTSVPNIIQQCDSLTASGQSPKTHIIPALIPVIDDIFLNRNGTLTSSEFTELETTQEVLFTMLLRLIDHHQIIDLLIICLSQSNKLPDNLKWKRWSELTIVCFISALTCGNLKIESKESFFTFIKLFSVIDINAYQPNKIQQFVKALLTKLESTDLNAVDRRRWIGSINVIMSVLISVSDEEIILSSLSAITVSDPLNVQKFETESLHSDDIFVKLIFNVIEICCTWILDLNKSLCFVNSSHLQHEITFFIVYQLIQFMQMTIFIFNSENYDKIKKAAMNFIINDEIHDIVIDVGKSWPIVTCKWMQILSLLKYNSLKFWTNVTENGDGLNSKIINKMRTIILYERINHDNLDTDLSKWYFENCIQDIVSLASELPITKLPIGDSMLKLILKIDLPSSKPSFIKNLLLCFENAHLMQSGAILCAVIPKFLQQKYVVLSRMAAKIASRRIEILLTLKPENVLSQLSKENYMAIVESLRTNKKLIKYGGLNSLLNKLGSQFYDYFQLTTGKECYLNDITDVTGVSLDKSWYISKVKKHCYNSDEMHFNHLSDTVQLLSKLNSEECSSIFASDNFNVKIIRDCIILGSRLTVEEMKSKNDGQFQENTLYSVAKSYLLKRIKEINKIIPQNHFILDDVVNKVNYDEDAKLYYRQISEFFNDERNWTLILQIIPAVIVYIKTLKSLKKYDSTEIDPEDFIKFATISLEMAYWIIHKYENQEIKFVKPHELELTLECGECVLKVYKNLNAERHYSKVCSMIATLVKIVNHFSHIKISSVNMTNIGLEEALQNEETKNYAVACIRISELIIWLEKGYYKNIPQFIQKLIRNLIACLGRQSLVNSFLLTPPQAWKAHYLMKGSGATKCYFPIMSSESNLLNDLEILEQFVYRINLIGWSCRLQFEEIWMALLSVINIYQHTEQAKSFEDQKTINYVNVLAIRAITKLLQQTLYLPNPGNPTNGIPVHVSRDPEIDVKSSKHLDKLFKLQDLILWKYKDLNNLSGSYPLKVENVFNRGNIEKRNDCEFGYGQLSVPYLWSLCGMHEEKVSGSISELVKRRDMVLKSDSIDLESCLQFLLELYTSWNYPQGNIPLCLKTEIARSLQSISDLFLKKSQFQWMLETCLNMVKYHHLEDDIFLLYIVFAVCKSASVLIPLDKDTQEKVLLLMGTAFKSTFLPVKIAVLHGTLYLLQGSILLQYDDLTNVVISMVSQNVKSFNHFPGASAKYNTTNKNEEYESVIWGLLFFILENVQILPANIVPTNVIEHASLVTEHDKVSTTLHQIIFQGLDRLVVTNSIDKNLIQRIIRIAIESLKRNNPILSIPATQLLLSCMYIEALDGLSISCLDENLLENEPEVLVRSIERSSVIFDKIKNAYYTEVEILCEVVSEIFNDFFFTSNILTKVIGEFYSSQQQHPKLMSAVVFKVCERTNTNSHLDLLQEWVLFSLPNFIKNLPIAMSTWFLSCFFISLSRNQWLRNIFPHVQSRIGKYESEDKIILSIAALDFYQQLSSNLRKQEFVNIFKVAGKKLGSPFNNVAMCIE